MIYFQFLINHFVKNELCHFNKLLCYIFVIKLTLKSSILSSTNNTATHSVTKSLAKNQGSFNLTLPRSKIFERSIGRSFDTTERSCKSVSFSRGAQIFATSALLAAKLVSSRFPERGSRNPAGKHRLSL